MKRFFCTVCKRVKRVRNYPTSVIDEQNTKPENRIGMCLRHTDSIIRTNDRIMNNRKRTA